MALSAARRTGWQGSTLTRPDFPAYVWKRVGIARAPPFGAKTAAEPFGSQVVVGRLIPTDFGEPMQQLVGKDRPDCELRSCSRGRCVVKFCHSNHIASICSQ